MPSVPGSYTGMDDEKLGKALALANALPLRELMREECLYYRRTI